MLEVDIDNLDMKILEVISHVKYWSADDVYAEITGFTHGRFGRTLINLKLANLAEQGFLKKDVKIRKGEQECVYSINTKLIVTDPDQE